MLRYNFFKDENKINQDYDRYKYLLKDFLNILEKEIKRKEDKTLDKYYKTIENSLKSNIWAYSQDDINFLINTTEMIKADNFEYNMYYIHNLPKKKRKIEILGNMPNKYESLIDEFEFNIKVHRDFKKIRNKLN